MPSYIEVGCRCGRMVRATREQGGAVLHCWSCGSDVLIPMARRSDSLLRSFVGAVGDGLRPQTVGFLLGGAVATTVLLMIPYLGNPLAFAVLVVACRLYQNLIRENSPPVRAGGAVDAPGDERPEWVDWAYSVLGAAALVAPFFVRGWTNPLPLPARLRGMIVVSSFAVWVLGPLLLYALNARNRRGAVPRRQAIAALARFPITSVMTFLMVPVGFCVLEASVYEACRTEMILRKVVEDFYPTPVPVLVGEQPYMTFRFDDLTMTVTSSWSRSEARLVYLNGLRRGYTLVGTIVKTLSRGLEIEFGGEQTNVTDPSYLMTRMVLACFIIGCAGVFLSIQARWLGALALFATDPPVVAARTARPDPTPAPAPASGPAPALDQRPVEPALETYATSSPSRGPAARTVLIVDGDRGFAVGLSRVLSDRGYAVLLASSAWEAIGLARGAKPDLILIDSHLPDRPGVELCRELRDGGLGPARPVLLATSSTATAAEISAMAGAADDYLIKPYVFEALIQRIAKHLQARV